MMKMARIALVALIVTSLFGFVFTMVKVIIESFVQY